MKFEHLQGLIAAPFTPMDKNGQLDTGIIPHYYQFLKQNGVTGAFICGSTGEGVSLTTSEKMQVAEAWSSATENDPYFKVMTLLGGNSISDCKELAKHARSFNLYGVSFTSPSYFKPANVEVLAKMCLEIAETVPDMPFYYYHIPVLTGANFSMLSLLQALDGKLSNLAGIKYTHEDFMDFQSCMNFRNGKYDMLWGRDENMLSALVLGAKGAVGSTFNYASSLYLEMITAFNQNDLKKARMLQQKSIDMIRLLGKYGGISVGKAYMKLVELDCGEFRLPVKNMDNQQFENFTADVQALGFSEFRSRQDTIKQ
ncbi:MAG: dihydrodipicolinate synthase family protein [Sphingobacteriales bacterium]